MPETFRKYRVRAVCLALFALRAFGQGAPAATSYPTDGFAVAFPNLPIVQQRSIPTDAGPVELHEYSEQLDAVSLVVTVSSYGESAAGKTADTMLQGAKAGALKNTAAHLQSETKIDLDGNPGLSYEAESGATHFSVRLYVVGNSLYQTLVASPVEKPWKNAAQFLDSFKLVPKPDR